MCCRNRARATIEELMNIWGKPSITSPSQTRTDSRVAHLTHPASHTQPYSPIPHPLSQGSRTKGRLGGRAMMSFEQIARISICTLFVLLKRQLPSMLTHTNLTQISLQLQVCFICQDARDLIRFCKIASLRLLHRLIIKHLRCCPDIRLPFLQLFSPSDILPNQ